MMSTSILLSTVILVSLINLPQTKEWKSIKPLHSSRTTVEQVLGPPSKGDAFYSNYDLEKEFVSIQYSSGPCNKGRRGGWNVPLNTVIGFSVTPKTTVTLLSLQLDPKNYKQIEEIETPGIVYYVNKHEGITYEAHNNIVKTIYYGPESKDDHLRCPDDIN